MLGLGGETELVGVRFFLRGGEFDLLRLLARLLEGLSESEDEDDEESESESSESLSELDPLFRLCFRGLTVELL